MDKNINGYIKLIGHSKKDNINSYKFYIEDDDKQLYCLSVEFNKIKNSNIVKNLCINIDEIDVKKIQTEDLFYVPGNAEDVSINVNDFIKNSFIRGYNIGTIATFNKDFFKIFDNQIFYINKDRVFDILDNSKDSFIDTIDAIRTANVQDVFIGDSLDDLYLGLDLDEDDIPLSEDFKIVERNHKLNAFGNFEI